MCTCQRFANPSRGSLNITTISAKIEKIGARKGELAFGLRLNSTTQCKVTEVASEGEQRAIAIAAFFAELQISPHKSAVVIDDPVSSLDYHRRKHVAKRLVEEAIQRQVIVFTHDSMFLIELMYEAVSKSIPIHRRHLTWENDQPGKCQDDFPWEAKKHKEQLSSLEQDCRALRTRWNRLPNPQNCSDMQHLYTRLRALSSGLHRTSW